MPTRVGFLAGAALTLLLAAWVMSTSPFAGPDEPSHYLRALSLANGHLVGPRVPYRNVRLTPQQQAWAAQDTRGVHVPARMSPGNELCLDGRPDLLGACVEGSYTGDYQPLPYLLPALALKASSDVGTGLWLSRLASALPSLGFILLALILATSGGGWSLVALFAAMTPMVLFVSSVLNPNGLEIAANLSCFAGLLWIVRDPSQVPSWVLYATAISAVVVVLSWALGPVFVALDACVAATLLTRERLARLARGRRRALLTGATALILAGVVYLLYGSTVGLLHSKLQLDPLRPSLHGGLEQLGPVLQDAVGFFGSRTVALPAPIYWFWWAMIAVLCAGAALAANRRGRIALASAVVTALAFPVLFWALVYRQTGWGLQGRYVLPMLVLAPMVAGEVIGGAARRLAGPVERSMIAGMIAVVAALQLLAWWVNARTAAGRPGQIWFQAHPVWSPPLGWWAWSLLSALGAALLLTVAHYHQSGPCRVVHPGHDQNARARWPSTSSS
ncbi:MAG: DUF2142 domain-containing protein [Solirubrobacteraceae bacterium]